MDQDDAELVRRIAAAGAGARQAEAELCLRMAPRIRLYGLRHMRAVHAAEDLTQQVLIITIEALRAGRLREPEKLASFVLGTCRLTVLDLRRNAQRKERLMELAGTELASLLPSAQHGHDGDALNRQRLAQCIQGLKERERSVIVLTFFDEKTGSDVAGFLGISEANVRVIRHRAIHQLRRCLGGAA